MLSTLFFPAALPAVLIVVAGMLVSRAGDPDARRRRFRLLLWCGLGLLAAILAEGWLRPGPGIRIGVLLAPAACGALAAVLIQRVGLTDLSPQERGVSLLAAGLIAGAAIVTIAAEVLRPGGPDIETTLLTLACLSAAGMLAHIWTAGARRPALAALAALASLALFNAAGVGALPVPSELPPALPPWLSVLSVVLYLAVPGLVLGAAALALVTALRPLPASAPVGRTTWQPVAGGLALAGLLLGGFVYTLVWLWIWDQADDGVRAFAFGLESLVAAIGAGMLISLATSGWRRLAGLIYAAAVPTLVAGTLLVYDYSFIHHRITEDRAARLRSAIERFHARTGSYPQELGQLVPSEVGWLPRPVIAYGQDWCYQASADSYRLGALYREFSTAPFTVRVYAAAGSPPEAGWRCDDELAVQNARHTAANPGAASTPAPLPTSVISLERLPVSPSLRADTLAVGGWSPQGEYLVLGVREASAPAETGLYFLRADTGEVCPAGGRKWATAAESDGVSQHFAWLPDGRLLYVSEAGEVVALTPCSDGLEDLTARYPVTFTQVVSFDARSGRVLLSAGGADWLLEGATLMARPIAGGASAPGEAQAGNAAWSPDGQRLVLARLDRQADGGDSRLDLVTVSTGELERTVRLGYTLERAADRAPIVDWLTNEQLLIQAEGGLIVMDLRTEPPATTNLIRDVFLLDAAFPTDFATVDYARAPDGDSYTLGVRVNHPRNQAGYVYSSETGQTQVFDLAADTLVFLPDGQWLRLLRWEDRPTYQDTYELVWPDQPGQAARLTVEGHTPRRYPQLFPLYRPAASQLIISSSQGVSLISLPDGETLHFWELAGAGGASSHLYPSPRGEALAIVAEGGGLYYIPLPSD